MMIMMISGLGQSFGECFLDLPAPDELSVESVGELINGFGPSFGECFLDLPAPDELSVESVGEPPKREGSTFIFMN